MRHLQVVKEHINIRRFIAYINIQITAFTDSLACTAVGTVIIAAAHLFKTRIGRNIIELLIK